MKPWHPALVLASLILFSGSPGRAQVEPARHSADTISADTSLGEADISEIPLTADDREHWAFQPISRPVLPVVQHSNWPQTGVDYFILQQLEQAGLAPVPRAARSVLLRRLKFDLLGLPPTPAELLRFEQDSSVDAYEQLVDQLLNSPAYGERWAQYWLDLARFAETDGFEHDKVRRDAWQYRQWVIDALNADMPYDQFVDLQLTGDLTGQPRDKMATMFCLAGPDMPDINEQDLRRHDKMNEITSTVAAVLLGLQMHCAQCHDHKYDPISQADFFRLRGLFEDAVPELKRDEPLVRLSAQAKPLAPWFYGRGELQTRGPAVRPRPPRIACAPDDSLAAFDNPNPRRAFVAWLFAKDNPLTARVIANRIWQHHFNRSLCENPSDFGVIAGGPSHPELLDWLATELRRHNWSLKHLHRLLVLSASYQQAGRIATEDSVARASWEQALIVDPYNERYSRFPRKRLEGEVIRDALLAVSDQLNTERGGPSVMPPLPPELEATLLKGQWVTTPGSAAQDRRSIYVFARRNLRYPIFDVFDRPDAGASCARRDRSTTAIQSLQMLNGDLPFHAAQHLCNRLLQEQAAANQRSSNELVERLFLTALSRHGSPAERERVRQLLESPSSPLCDNLLAACVAILNSNEFVYVD